MTPRVYNRNVDVIVRAVCEELNTTIEEVMSPSHSKTAVRARRLAMHVVRIRYEWSSPEIGRYFGRDHSTVLAALRNADLDIAMSRRTAEIVRKLIEAEVVAA